MKGMKFADTLKSGNSQGIMKKISKKHDKKGEKFDKVIEEEQKRTNCKKS